MKRRKMIACVTALSMAVVLLAGCGAAETQADRDEVTNAASRISIETPLETVESTETIESTEEERVVATSVAVVEILDALGVPITGVPTSSYDLPESVTDAARIGNPMSPDMEVITLLEPTVIISVDSLSDDLKEQFDTTGAESFFVNLSGYEGLKESVTSLGERFGIQDKAAEIITGFEEKESSVKEQTAEKEGPAVLIIFGANSCFMVASEDTYVGDLVKRGGGSNIITEAPSAFSLVDMEYLADKNPDYILFMAHANPEESLAAFPEEFDKNEAWQHFDAVKNDKVYALETGYFGMSANLLATDAMEKLADIFYGEN